MNVLKLTLGFIALVLIVGCKKYDDGPLFSVRSAEHRLEKRWYLIGVTNNVPPDSLYYDTRHLIGDVWMFDSDTLQLEKRLGGIGRLAYQLVDGKEKVRVDFPSWYYNEDLTEFEIHRLTGKDLKLVSLTEPQFTLIFSNKKL